MSKNVAVFVDVANIFYAAKAAGVDIDYVTLLKAATAGRDFVRAYAYTGLDPENENQRQFHAFLARSNYKVISKDIRKYGDGRVKANLDIELVVDMMKTARNLDIAVVVSGDGDFASAIRAVQEMGVRVEVISFRGNTSSDLIEAADLFIDIAQVARVEKGSARSGRRVAADGDLSMTEVPEKETEGAPRRRRATRTTRETRPVAAAAAAAAAPAAAAAVTPAAETDAQGGNLVVLPGERLSRAADGEETGATDAEQAADIAAEQAADIAAEQAADAAAGDGSDAAGEDGRRRRRRRGGRGRGRGRRGDEEPLSGAEPAAAAAATEEDEEFEEIRPAPLPHHTFGSVWDTQLGVPTASMPPAVDLGGTAVLDDEDLDEPEVPEYLLAERRDRGQRGRGRPVARGRGSYQAALDRERYGRSAPQPSFGGPNRVERSRDRGRQSRPQGGRQPDRAPRPPERQRTETRPMTESRPSSEPWSEVPPEMEEMLRAELARKKSPTSETRSSAESAPAVEQPSAKPARRPRTTKAATPAPADAVESAATATPAEEPATQAAPAKAKRSAPRKPTTRAKAAPKAAKAKAAAASAEVSGEEPKKPVRRRRTTKTTAGEEG